MEIEIEVERLSRARIGEIADNFLAQENKSQKFPVEIELIAENLGIRVTPIPNLKDISGIEGFIRSNLTEIVVDEQVYFTYPNRARATIAHEVGHFVLHQKIFEKVRKIMNPKSFEDYADFLVGKISSDDHGWIEWQSYEFAGQVLVPKGELKVRLEDLINTRKKMPDDVALPIIEELAVYFEVSSQVIEKRIRHEKLVEFAVKRGI